MVDNDHLRSWPEYFRDKIEDKKISHKIAADCYSFFLKEGFPSIIGRSLQLRNCSDHYWFFMEAVRLLEFAEQELQEYNNRQHEDYEKWLTKERNKLHSQQYFTCSSSQSYTTQGELFPGQEDKTGTEKKES